VKKTAIIIHHTGSEADSVKTIDSAHKKRGWDGIGYDIVITNGFNTVGDSYHRNEDGRIYLGRSFEKKGAHCPVLDPEVPGASYNSTAFGISVVGPSPMGQLTERQMRALILVVDYLVSQTGIRPSRILGHKETGEATLCPGNIPVDKIRRLMAMKYPKLDKSKPAPRFFSM
jgi:hypothetical protein